MLRTALLASSLILAAIPFSTSHSQAQDAAANGCSQTSIGITKTLTAITHIPIRTRIGSLRSLPDWKDWAPAANGCLLQGRTAGLDQRYDRVLDAVMASLKDWRPEVDKDADGPGSAVRHFVRGDQHLILELALNTPPGVCRSVIYADCKAPAKRWMGSLKAAAYP